MQERKMKKRDEGSKTRKSGGMKEEKRGKVKRCRK